MQRLVYAGRGATEHVFRQCLLAAALILSAAAICPALAGEHANKNVKDVKAGFLVLAPDRGFAGNEEIGDAFDVFAKGRNASLVFITDERSSKYVKSGFDKLVDSGARRITVIPLFISAADPRYRLTRKLLEQEKPPVPVAYTPLYGETFFAAEDLADRFRLVGDPSNSRLIIAGYGATDDDNEQAMRADLRRIAESAGGGFGFASIEVVIAYDVQGEEGEKRAARFRRQLAEAASAGDATAPAPVVVRFHFGPRFDSMMSFDAQLKRQLPPDVRFIQNNGADDAAATNLAIWLAHAANRSQQLAREDFGIIVLSHGSDFIWNQSVRDAVEPLTKDYKVEFAFSMADQAMIERAVRKLEQRRAKAAIIVRLFALADSFRRPVERMTGADIEGATAAGLGRAGNEHGHGKHGKHGKHGGHGGHGHDASAGPAPRIRSPLPIETVGGARLQPAFCRGFA